MMLDNRDRQIITMVAADRVVKLAQGWRTGGMYTTAFDDRVSTMVEGGLIREVKGRAVLTAAGKTKL